MKESLSRIFDFLNENRQYNKELQTRYYSGIINSQNTKAEKVISLLYHIANTQSQPRIDYLAAFYKKIYLKKELLSSFEGFLSVVSLDESEGKNYKTLFDKMNSQNGWGYKTSALFVKTIYHLHNNEYPEELKIWNDAPKDLENGDKLYLPVDTVIITIFNKISPKKWTFKNINSTIKDSYNGKDIEVWDDLWFWGFISQIGTGDGRKMGWNLNKYWTLRESDKNPKMIEEIKNKADVFLSLIQNSTSQNTH